MSFLVICNAGQKILNARLLSSSSQPQWKARQLYEQFAREARAQRDNEDKPQPGSLTGPEEPIAFQASKGWFDRFQKGFQLKSVHGEAASADVETAKKYP
ncbi:hypothetical protein JRQ81_000224 [Phrynocephalus forsythii]|uniref:HTH CENPB-type domain-containing protein n=1 Tax=Phrynocephalus forsythii TaxID=171643 RepID=A0A9Q0Y7M9_9SAUR|nr:hypothetical protein JRQ81_000224 [Phrynocephalus forsythii]